MRGAELSRGRLKRQVYERWDKDGRQAEDRSEVTSEEWRGVVVAGAGDLNAPEVSIRLWNETKNEALEQAGGASVCSTACFAQLVSSRNIWSRPCSRAWAGRARQRSIKVWRLLAWHSQESHCMVRLRIGAGHCSSRRSLAPAAPRRHSKNVTAGTPPSGPFFVTVDITKPVGQPQTISRHGETDVQTLAQSWRTVTPANYRA
jgi:hypothetical protein